MHNFVWKGGDTEGTVGIAHQLTLQGTLSLG